MPELTFSFITDRVTEGVALGMCTDGGCTIARSIEDSGIVVVVVATVVGTWAPTVMTGEINGLLIEETPDHKSVVA